MFSLIAIAGNGVVICLITFRRRLHKTDNRFVLSLAAVDFCVGFFIVPSLFACEFAFGCLLEVQILFYELLLFVSVGNLFSMTLDRYVAVTRPLRYRAIMSPSRVRVLIGLAWGVPGFTSLLPLAWRFGNADAKETAERAYRAFVIVAFVFLPVVALLTAYVRIFVLVRKLARQVNRQRVQLSFNGEPLPCGRVERPTSRVLGAVILIFVCCWLLSGYRALCTFFLHFPVSRSLERVSRLLFFCNSAANPFVYSFLKTDIRRELRKLLCRSTSPGSRPVASRPLVIIARGITFRQCQKD